MCTLLTLIQKSFGKIMRTRIHKRAQTLSEISVQKYGVSFPKVSIHLPMQPPTHPCTHQPTKPPNHQSTHIDPPTCTYALTQAPTHARTHARTDEKRTHTRHTHACTPFETHVHKQYVGQNVWIKIQNKRERRHKKWCVCA